MFDPCGTRRLDGDEIIKRLAAELGILPNALKETLLRLHIERCLQHPASPEEAAG